MPQERLTLRGNDRHFLQVAVSPVSKLLAAGQQDGTVKIWQMPAGTEWFTHPGKDVPVVDFSASVFGLTFNPKGDTLAWTSGKSVVLFDVHSKKVKGTLDGHERDLIPLAFSPDGSTLATANRGFVRLWDLAAKKPQVIFEQSKTKYHEPEQAPELIRSLAFHPSGKTLAIGIGWNVVLLDLTRGGAEIASVKLADRAAVTLAFSPNGKLLAGAGGKVVLWDAATAKEVAVIPRNHGGSIQSVAFSPDDKMLAIGITTHEHGASYVEIWDIEKGREAASFVCGNRPLQHLAWSADGKTIAIANSGDNSVKVWDVPTILKNGSKGKS